MAISNKLIHHRDMLFAHIRDHEWKTGRLEDIAKGHIEITDIMSVRLLATIVLLDLLIADSEVV